MGQFKEFRYSKKGLKLGITESNLHFQNTSLLSEKQTVGGRSGSSDWRLLQETRGDDGGSDRWGRTRGDGREKRKDFRYILDIRPMDWLTYRV